MGLTSGGTAGRALASRLSEDPSISVVLLESGPILNSWSSRVPLLSADYQLNCSPAYKRVTALTEINTSRNPIHDQHRPC